MWSGWFFQNEQALLISSTICENLGRSIRQDLQFMPGGICNPVRKLRKSAPGSPEDHQRMINEVHKINWEDIIMLKNIRLITKLSIGFGVMALLAILISIAGLRGIYNIQDRLHKADEVNRLVKDILQARQHEKNFIISLLFDFTYFFFKCPEI